MKWEIRLLTLYALLTTIWTISPFLTLYGLVLQPISTYEKDLAL